MKLALIGSGRIILDALYALKAVDSVEVKALYVREWSLPIMKLCLIMPISMLFI